jgi:hypothetical protein
LLENGEDSVEKAVRSVENGEDFVENGVLHYKEEVRWFIFIIKIKVKRDFSKVYINTYYSRFISEGEHRYLRYSTKTPMFYQN